MNDPFVVDLLVPSEEATLMHGRGYKSKAIIRTSIGSERPLHPQFQHVGDYSNSIKAMCPRIHIVKLQNPKNIFKEIESDLLIVFAYGKIIPNDIFDLPTYGSINVHTSILPSYRGAAPIQRAIEAGDRQTGITAMHMECGLDTGAMLHQLSTEIAPDETSKTLHDRLADLTADCLLETLNLIEKNTLSPVIQPEQGVCYAHKISKSETRLDLRQSLEKLERKIRAFSPVPACWLELADGSRLKILEASVTDKLSELPIGSAILSDDKTDTDFGIVVADKNILFIRQLQPAGKKPMTGAAYLNGTTIRNGDIIWSE